MVAPAIGQPINHPRISVEIKNDRFIRRKQTVKIPVSETMRMIIGRLKAKEIDNVYELKLELQKF